MNYYNPYFYTMPSSFISPKPGIISRLLGGKSLTFGTIFNGTQRALSFANQAIPIVKQIKPMVGNAKTMFRVMNEFKRIDKKDINIKEYSKPANNNTVVEEKTISTADSGPTFFA